MASPKKCYPRKRTTGNNVSTEKAIQRWCGSKPETHVDGHANEATPQCSLGVIKKFVETDERQYLPTVRTINLRRAATEYAMLGNRLRRYIECDRTVLSI